MSGKHGGSRPRQRPDDQRGGARVAGAGKKQGPPKQNLHIDVHAAHKLQRIWRARSAHEPGLTEDEIVTQLILTAAEPATAEDWYGETL